MSGNEPSDALRVVNALLTQLDKLKHRKNVLVMSTSNLAQAIGEFASRMSHKQTISIVTDQCVRLRVYRLCLHGSSRYRAICWSSTTGRDLLDIELMLERADAGWNNQYCREYRSLVTKCLIFECVKLIA